MTTQTKYRKYDSESDYYAMGYRMYSAELGRFLAVDPLFEAMPRHNPYHYSFNSPMFWSDPSGLFPLSLNDLKFFGDALLEMVDKELAYIKSQPRYDAGTVTQEPEESFQSREGGGGGNNGSFIGNIVSSVVNFFSNLFGGGDDEGEEIDMPERILDIRPIRQNDNDACFIACIKAVLEFYNIDATQTDIRNRVQSNNPGSDIQSVLTILDAYNFEGGLNTSFSIEDIINSINNDIPIITATKADPNVHGLKNHAVIIYGYKLYQDGSFYLYVMDPAKSHPGSNNLSDFYWTNENGTRKKFIIITRRRGE